MGRSGKIDGVALQVLERDDVERRLMRRGKDDPRRVARLERLAPARGAQAPAVAWLEPGKPEVRLRRRQVIAPRLGEFEELGGHLDAHCMQPEILGPSMAGAGAEEASERPLRAALQRLAIDVPLRRHGLLLPPFLHPAIVPDGERDGEGRQAGSKRSSTVRGTLEPIVAQRNAGGGGNAGMRVSW